MALSIVQICNLALARIGVTDGIAALSDNLAEARACQLAYEPCRDDLIGSYDWPFARRSAALGLVAEDPTEEWGYSFRVPSDCLLARRIDQGGDYEIAGDSSGRLLYANAEAVTLSYTARIDDVGLIPHQVAMALAWRMAVELAPALAKTESAADRAQVNYQRALATALHTCMNEPRKPAAADAEAVAAREA